MDQYILLIHGNSKSKPTEEQWNQFFTSARESGVFRGGSEIGARICIGETDSINSSDHISGFMRFDSDNKQKILDLLEIHPVILNGGTVELCEMPKS